MRLRQSTIKRFMSCPAQVRFAEIDQLPEPENWKQFFGTAIHFCLEKLNLGQVDTEQAKTLFLDLMQNPEKLACNPTVMPKMTTFGGLENKGLWILDNFAGKYRWEDRQLVATEHQFLVPFGRHELSGTVDLIELRDNHKGKRILRVCDYKTNTRKPSFTELAVNVQFTVYSYATQQREFWVGNGADYPGLPDGEAMFEALADVERRSIWYHLWTGAELDAGTRGEADIGRLYRVCDEIERAIELDVFVPDISGETCIFCPYVKPCCDVDIPSPDELIEQEAAWA